MAAGVLQTPPPPLSLAVRLIAAVAGVRKAHEVLLQRRAAVAIVLEHSIDVPAGQRDRVLAVAQHRMVDVVEDGTVGVDLPAFPLHNIRPPAILLLALGIQTHLIAGTVEELENDRVGLALQNLDAKRATIGATMRTTGRRSLIRRTVTFALRERIAAKQREQKRGDK